MRLIHQSDYSLEERLMYKPIVYANAIQSMSILLNAVEKLSEYQGFDLYNHLELTSINLFICCFNLLANNRFVSKFHFYIVE